VPAGWPQLKAPSQDRCSTLELRLKIIEKVGDSIEWLFGESRIGPKLGKYSAISLDHVGYWCSRFSELRQDEF
jgi:hypothetical protein